MQISSTLTCSVIRKKTPAFSPLTKASNLTHAFASHFNFLPKSLHKGAYRKNQLPPACNVSTSIFLSAPFLVMIATISFAPIGAATAARKSPQTSYFPRLSRNSSPFAYTVRPREIFPRPNARAHTQYFYYCFPTALSMKKPAAADDDVNERCVVAFNADRTFRFSIGLTLVR